VRRLLRSEEDDVERGRRHRPHFHTRLIRSNVDLDVRPLRESKPWGLCRSLVVQSRLCCMSDFGETTVISLTYGRRLWQKFLNGQPSLCYNNATMFNIVLIHIITDAEVNKNHSTRCGWFFRNSELLSYQISKRTEKIHHS